jgi:hypothetical protein
MRLVERHIIKRSHLGFKEVDRIAFLAKNLFNSALYPSPKKQNQSQRVRRTGGPTQSRENVLF